MDYNQLEEECCDQKSDEIQKLTLSVNQNRILKKLKDWKIYYHNNEIIRKSKKKYNKSQGILRLLIYILLILYAGLVFYDDGSNQEIYEQFLQNQNQEIIADIYIEWSASTCQTSYQPIFNYNFKQEILGCDCSQTDQPEIQTGKECHSSQLKKGCFTFSQKLQSNLTYLNNNNFGSSFIICVKRENNISLKNNSTYCEQEEKNICGKDLKYCLPKNISCPITEIGIRQFAEIDQQYKNKSINLGNRQFFFFGYNENILPISEVLLIKGEKVCKLNKNLPFSQQEIYQENKQISCQYFDTLFKIVYTISEEQLFLSNNLIQYKNELNHFYVDSIHNWTLQTKPYTLISDECQYQDIFKKMLTNEYETEINRKKIIQFIVITTVICFLFLKHCICNKFIKQCSQSRRIQQYWAYLQKKGILEYCCSQIKGIQEFLSLIDQILLILTYLMLFLFIIIIRDQINSIMSEVHLILQFPCILLDEANNYLKTFIEDHSFSNFSNILYWIMIGLLITFAINQLIITIQFYCKIRSYLSIKSISQNNSLSIQYKTLQFSSLNTLNNKELQIE